MTVAETLHAISNYPIPVSRLEMICIECGISSESVITPELVQLNSYKRAKAEVYHYLAFAPSIIENGISISFTDEDKKRFLAMYRALMNEIGEDVVGGYYGYIGENL